MGELEMWNDITEQLFYTDHGRGGVAPARHELAKRGYIEKAISRREAEQRAATTGVLHDTAGKLLTRMGAWLTRATRASRRAPVLQARP